MRIISRFHDYYDGLNDGSDTDHVWIRDESGFCPNLNDPFYRTEHRETSLENLMAPVSVPKLGAVYWQLNLRKDDLDSYRRSLLFFCGEFYPLVRLPDRVCWTFEAFAEAVKLAERPYCKNSWCYAQSKVFARVRAMFSREGIPPQFKTLNLRLKRPIVLIDIVERWCFPPREHKDVREVVEISTNPPLGKLGFASVIPPFDAFQKLESYLFNELAEQRDPPVNISDEVRRDSHGFDKFSFRKDPTKKR